ncbi:uncharacterized protein LOC118774233 isoform X4 [Megalops cyprinoides]|uniref:uncharacterized protein LOC118774233 isoform X4 n=1 Tax=Megalops cyprinoides TaxID=118141 RepID=UPI001864271F|nr:uncharacterized protein LOC118774233 isoform X4 [Megalops cyprinoides]
MYCVFCGEQLVDGGRFCACCGRNRETSLTEAQNENTPSSTVASQENLIEQYFHAGHAYKAIVDLLKAEHGICVSLRTVKSRLSSLGLFRRKYSQSEDVRRAVVQELQGPGQLFGYRTMWQVLKNKYRLNAKRSDVMRLLAKTNPSGTEARRRRRLARRTYHSLGSNYTWHAEGYDKRKPFGFAVKMDLAVPDEPQKKVFRARKTMKISHRQQLDFLHNSQSSFTLCSSSSSASSSPAPPPLVKGKHPEEGRAKTEKVREAHANRSAKGKQSTSLVTRSCSPQTLSLSLSPTPPPQTPRLRSRSLPPSSRSLPAKSAGKESEEQERKGGEGNVSSLMKGGKTKDEVKTKGREAKGNEGTAEDREHDLPEPHGNLSSSQDSPQDRTASLVSSQTAEGKDEEKKIEADKNSKSEETVAMDTGPATMETEALEDSKPTSEDTSIPVVNTTMSCCCSSPSKPSKPDQEVKEGFLVLSEEDDNQEGTEKAKDKEQVEENQDGKKMEVETEKGDKTDVSPLSNTTSPTSPTSARERKRQKVEGEELEAQLELKIRANASTRLKLEKVVQQLVEEQLRVLQLSVFDRTLQELKERVEKMDCATKHQQTLNTLQAKIARLAKKFGAANQAKENIRKPQEMESDTAPERNAQDSYHSCHSMPLVDDHNAVGSAIPNEQMESDTAPERNAQDSYHSGHSMPLVDDHNSVALDIPNNQMESDTAPERNAQDSYHSCHYMALVDDHNAVGSEIPNEQMESDTAPERNAQDSYHSGHSMVLVDDHNAVGSAIPNEQIESDTAPERNAQDSYHSCHSMPLVDDHNSVGSEIPNNQSLEWTNIPALGCVPDSIEDSDGEYVCVPTLSRTKSTIMESDTAPERNAQDSYHSCLIMPLVDDHNAVGSEIPNEQSLDLTNIPELGCLPDFSEDSDGEYVCALKLRRTKSIIMKESIPEDSDELFHSHSGDDYIPDSREDSGDSSSDSSTSLKISEQKHQSLIDRPIQPTGPVPDSTTAVGMDQDRSSVRTEVMGVREKPSTSSEKIEDEGVSSSQDGFESEEGTVVVTAVQKKYDGSRLYNKRHYCLYCFKPCSKIARHLEHVHSSEREVAKACSLPKGSKQRRIHFDYLRNRGNYVHNAAVLKSGKGELIPCKRPPEAAKGNDFLHCAYCRGLFTRNVLWRHVKTCKLSPKNVTKKPGKSRVQSLCAFTQPVPSCISKTLWKVLSSMNLDEIATAVRNDSCIIQIGEHLLNKSGSSAKSQQCIRQKLRELGRLLIGAKKITSLRRMEDFIDPERFTETVKAVKFTCGYDSETHKYKVSSLATKLGNILVKLSKLLKAQALITKNEGLVQKATDFQEVYKARWNELISATASHNTAETKWNAPTVLRFTEDVQKLHAFLNKMQDECISQLSAEATSKAWSDLAKVAMAQIILFNRRREGEVSSMALSSFLSRDNSSLHDDIEWALSEVEKKLCRHFSRIVIKGKRARPVPILLTPKMLCALESLVEKRETCGVVKDNCYMFARPSAMSHFRGSDCMRIFAKACGAKSPDALTSTKLRKHAATLSTVLNMRDTEIDQLANLLGHDIRIRREYDCLSEKTLQLAKVNKILMALEQGRLAEFKGKNLDQINMDPNEEVGVCSDEEDESGDEGSCALGLDDTSATEGLPPPDREMMLPTDCKTIPPTDREVSPVIRLLRSHFKGQKATQKKRKAWDVTEVQAVERHMKNFITTCRIPGKTECERCLRTEPLALKYRNWQSVKFYVYNRIVAYKRSLQA